MRYLLYGKMQLTFKIKIMLVLILENKAVLIESIVIVSLTGIFKCSVLFYVLPFKHFNMLHILGAKNIPDW